jgi:hypothetical protein
LTITLDTDKRFEMRALSDCCAYAAVETFLLHTDKIENIITGVSVTDDYTTWHVLAGMDSVLDLEVGWSEGSGYYMYGFEIEVVEK